MSSEVFSSPHGALWLEIKDLAFRRLNLVLLEVSLNLPAGSVVSSLAFGRLELTLEVSPNLHHDSVVGGQ